jgi:hypothetical protein
MVCHSSHVGQEFKLGTKEASIFEGGTVFFRNEPVSVLSNQVSAAETRISKNSDRRLERKNGLEREIRTKS